MFRFMMVLFCAAWPLSAARGGITVECDVTIEITALRGASPTVNVPGTKNITAKARIQKGKGPADQTLDNTSLIIEAFDGPTLVDTQMSPNLLTLVSGKGGQGDKLTMTISDPNNDCVSGFIDFSATFTGTSSTNGTICTETTALADRLRKTCKF